MRKLVKGLARPEPRWLRAMEEAAPVTFPRMMGRLRGEAKQKEHPDSLCHDAINGFDPPPARAFAWRSWS
uniref:Uncharacterized protein n=1 Tax=Zea mays TaxID=4577 RepID=A0A804MCW2_MAIZE